jgi:hypothetical protein
VAGLILIGWGKFYPIEIAEKKVDWFDYYASSSSVLFISPPTSRKKALPRQLKRVLDAVSHQEVN